MCRSSEAEVSDSLAVLVSGGLDSAVLLAEMLNEYVSVWPLYIQCGLYWEVAEINHLRKFLEEICVPTLRELTVLKCPVADLYGQHWSLTGVGVPDSGSPDEAVYLPGRNVLFLAKGMLWCHLHEVPTLALAPLESNPFSDATPSFFSAFESVVNRAIEGTVRVVQPYRGMHKEEVILRGRHLPLEWTFSCIRPIEGRHCGRCNKCAERRSAFSRAGCTDPTMYQKPSSAL